MSREEFPNSSADTKEAITAFLEKHLPGFHQNEERRDSREGFLNSGYGREGAEITASNDYK